jgi:putative ABC transport system substrate-binding protein
MKAVRGQWATVSKSLRCFAICAVVLAFSISAEAQQVKKVPRIGFLGSGSSSSMSSRIEAFRQGLGDLGYVEGKNITIEYRYAEAKPGRAPDLAAELVRLKVDVIVTSATGPVRAAKDASKTIPIVFTGIADPVEEGLVSSLAKPGGNITGLSLLAPELNGKRLELLKEAFPNVSRVAFLWQMGRFTEGRRFREAEAGAKRLALRLQSVGVKGVDDFESAFEVVRNGGAKALITSPSPLFNTYLARIVEFAIKNRLPAIYPSAAFIEAGGLMSYGPDILDNWRRAATYVDKILKGTKPADLPVEQPKKFEFVINLKAAKQIGLTIPPNVLAEPTE